jgi:hypothetical protein
MSSAAHETLTQTLHEASTHAEAMHVMLRLSAGLLEVAAGGKERATRADGAGTDGVHRDARAPDKRPSAAVTITLVGVGDGGGAIGRRSDVSDGPVHATIRVTPPPDSAARDVDLARGGEPQAQGGGVLGEEELVVVREKAEHARSDAELLGLVATQLAWRRGALRGV